MEDGGVAAYKGEGTSTEVVELFVTWTAGEIGLDGVSADVGIYTPSCVRREKRKD